MHTFTVELSEVEYKAFQYVAVDPAAWIQNAASERARLAMIELVEGEVERMMSDPSVNVIPATPEEIIENAYLPTAAERQQALEASQNKPLSE